jgi:hypothetical protein
MKALFQAHALRSLLWLVAAMLASTAIASHAQGLAVDCAGIQAAGVTADGEYIIAPGDQPFVVHCMGMDGTPREYLTLARTGGGYNYSAYGRIGAAAAANVVTHYARIRLDPATLLVDIGDQTFASSSGWLCCIGSTPVVSMPFANAASCGGDDDGHANVDLTGTPFRVRDTLTLGGWLPQGSVNGTALSGEGSASVDAPVVTLTGGGSCGGIGPNPGGNINSDGGFDLQLAYSGGGVVGKDSCKSDGWQAFGVFKTQGDCVSFFASKGRNFPEGL